MYDDEWRKLPDWQQITYVIGMTAQRDVVLEMSVGGFMDELSKWWRGTADKFSQRRDLMPMLDWCQPIIRRSGQRVALRRLLYTVIEDARAAHRDRSRMVHDRWSTIDGIAGVFAPGVRDWRSIDEWEQARNPANRRSIDDFLAIDIRLRKAVLRVHAASGLVTDTALPPGHRGFMVVMNTEIAKGNFDLNDAGELIGLPAEALLDRD